MFVYDHNLPLYQIGENFFFRVSNLLNPTGPGGGGAESARADFNLGELPCYLSNNYETLPLLLKFIGEYDSGKLFCQGYKLLPW